MAIGLLLFWFTLVVALLLIDRVGRKQPRTPAGRREGDIGRHGD